jgi:CheY-like chemotaxis protein
VADAPSRQVVLIVEDEALVRLTAVGMIEEAGFEALEATNADEAILLLEPGATSAWSSPISKCRVDGRPQARRGRQRSMAAHQNHRDIGPLRCT